MGEARRRKLANSGFVDRAVVIKQFADTVLRGAARGSTVAVGPVVWDLEAGYDVRHWYFIVGSADAHGEFQIDSFKIAHNERAVANQCRAALVMELVQRQPPMAIHSFDDELDMMRFCEAVFPCDKTRELRASVERERAS